MDTKRSTRKSLSIVVPFFNEEENIRFLSNEIVESLEKIDCEWKIIFVNDGSSDNSLEVMQAVAAENNKIIVIDLRRNYGQTAAMMAGFDHAKGEIIIAMDGDGQNDPAEIQKLLDEMDKGFDVVSGWRRDRKDKTISKKIPSNIANAIISRVSGVHLHDYGCSLKAYKREVLEHVRLYGEMHRFIPIYTSWEGGKVSEVPVNHRARLHGQSKYGLNRIFKVILDLMFVTFMEHYLTKPIYVFGSAALALLATSGLCTLWAVYLKIFEDVSFSITPLPVLIGTFFTTGVTCLLMGILAELLTRTYYESQNKKIYKVRSITHQDNL